MCLVSEKLKLCTCATQQLEKLKHYWIFHKLVKGKDLVVMGETVPPYYISLEKDKLNKALLLKLLNEGEVFDVEIQPNKGDRLQLSFSAGKNTYERINYGFVYKKNQWVELEYNVFDWMEKHEEEKFGKIENALNKQE